MDCGWGFLDILTLVTIPTEQAFWVLQFLLSFWVSNLHVNFLNRTPCWPPGMTEESRHILLTNKINFVPALYGPSNMNAFTIFIQNSSLVDNHSTKYISVTLIWMIKYVQYLIIAWIITSHLESFYRHN